MSVYPVASIRTHNAACGCTSYALLDEYQLGGATRNGTHVRLCANRSCPHPLHADCALSPKTLPVVRVPGWWADYPHLRPMDEQGTLL